MKDAPQEQVVVVTGASSGLGRETAVQLAGKGYRLVLAARKRADLEETALLCEAAGKTADVYAMDVTLEDDVARLVRWTLEKHGRIDVWINNAGVTYFSPIDEGSFEEHRRVIETNLYGPIFAARSIVPVFRRQHRGILINVGSVLSKVGQPFVPSYVISKFGLRGLSEALRAELAEEPHIHVCSIFPYAIDTPHFENGGNDTGRQAFAMPPVQSPEKVAKAVVQLIRRPRRERHLPRIAAVGLMLHWLAPRTTERLLLRSLNAWHFGPRTERRGPGNLYRPPTRPGSEHGSRRPRLSTPRFIGWALRELVKIEGTNVRRMLTHA